MSRYSGNDDECEVCGLKYRDLRTGLTFADVKAMLWKGPDPETWVYKRRNTVLGLWHQIKQSMWDEHLYHCERSQEEAEG